MTTNDILNMALSPTEDNVLCSTRRQQLYSLTLSVADLQGNVSCIIAVMGYSNFYFLFFFCMEILKSCMLTP